jgi:hypothetical protein
LAANRDYQPFIFFSGQETGLLFFFLNETLHLPGHLRSYVYAMHSFGMLGSLLQNFIIGLGTDYLLAVKSGIAAF